MNEQKLQQLWNNRNDEGGLQTTYAEFLALYNEVYQSGKDKSLEYIKKNSEEVYSNHAVPFLAVNQIILQEARKA